MHFKVMQDCIQIANYKSVRTPKPFGLSARVFDAIKKQSHGEYSQSTLPPLSWLTVRDK